MMRERWLSAVEFLAQNLFWGIGYFFGFTLVTMLSVGTLFAEEYSCIINGHDKPHRFCFFRREGNIYVIAKLVALIGWLFLASVVWTLLYTSNTV